MTTISVKFRQSTVEGKAGTVFYQVIHKRRMARINTDIHVLPCEWNKMCGQASGGNGVLMYVRSRIDKDLSVAYQIVAACDKEDKAVSAKGIVELFKASPRPSPKERECQSSGGFKYGNQWLAYSETGNATEFLCSDGAAYQSPPPLGELEGAVAVLSFSSFIHNRISELRKERRYSTAANYQHTLNSFVSFAENENIGCVTLSMIKDSLIGRYEAWLKSRGVKRNTTSFYTRILRAVYNLAVRQGLVRQTYPFRNVYTGIDTTRKRALKEETIAALNSLDLADKPKLRMARDMFLFCFATCGMPFVDMAHLKHSDIKDGYIRYERRKTGQPLQVKVTPFVADIIKRYRQDASPYIFPILTPSPLGEGWGGATFKQYRTALVAYNRHLKEISKLLPDGDRLTSYVSRHSWATIARDHGGTAADIGKALGHTSERTTQIYLGSINDTVVDKMNEEVMRCLQKIST